MSAPAVYGVIAGVEYPRPKDQAKVNYCPQQARKTPMIPWHNTVIRDRGMVCLACGRVIR